MLQSSSGKKTTGTFSQNVGKLISELKLVTDNLSSFMQKPTGEATESHYNGFNVHMHNYIYL